MLLTAMTIMMAARRHHWMQTWLAARMLAETLRYAKFLLVAGRVAPFGDIMRMQATKRLGHNWVRAYARHALRAHPLSALRRGVDADPDAAREIARYVRHACIADQIGYHRGAIARNRILERTLWLAGEILSYAAVTFALAECAALIAVRYFKATPSPALDAWAPLLAIFLPAITAAVLSWRNVGENDAVAKRSEAMEAFLIDSDRRIAHAMTTDDFDLMTLGGLMVPVVRRLLRDVDGWAELFNSKETSMG
jgi:hypothetical protein